MRSEENLLNGVKVVLALVVVCAFAGTSFGDYCSASGGCTGSGGTLNIDSVQVGSINNTGTGCSGYADYTSLSTTMEIGTGYPITVTNGDPYDEDDQCGIWVDWNVDEDFDDVNETIVMSGGPGTFTGTITPPEAAVLSATRMRVRIRWSGSLEPCGDTTYGEVEDYTLIVTDFVSPGYGGGSGTVADPYLIYTAEQMNTIGVAILDWDKHFKLMADIDLGGYTGTSFNIIGIKVFPFSGVFDGAGHTISNFTYDGGYYVGLFGYIDDVNAEVRDLGMIEPDINTGGNYVGAIAGYLSGGSITNCYVEGGSIAGDFFVGGLVGFGRNSGISDCSLSCDVTGRADWVGGLGGYNSNSNIFNCSSTGDVAGRRWVGGLVGVAAHNSIEGCYSTGSVSCMGYGVGGLVGVSTDDSILNCHSSGDVAGNYDVGGLVGNLDHSYISGCYSSSTVTAGWFVGGLTGFNHAGNTILDCYSTGSVTGYRDFAGGLSGTNGYGTILNCYSTAGVDGNKVVGGLVGHNGNVGNIVDCYSAGRVTGQQVVGGFVGKNGNVVSSCFSTGDVVGETLVGGFLGWALGGVISDCYALGDACGVTEVGGLVGLSDDSAETYHCYSAGIVDGNDLVGGFVGYSEYYDDYEACFWDSDVNPGLSGIGNRSDPCVTGQTTANMHTQSTFTDAGWDFTTPIWKMNCEGMSYPKLSWWQPVLGDFGCPDGVDGIDLAVLCQQWLFEELSADVAPDGGDGFVNFLDWTPFAEKWQITVDFDDLADFADQWLKTGSSYLIADIAPLADGDGIVNVLDFAALAENWLAGL